MYYYFISCTTGTIYGTLITSYQSAFGSSAVVGNVYLLRNITDLPDGCYTCTTAAEVFTEFTGYVSSSTSQIVENGCDDGSCDAIFVQNCNIPGVFYEVIGYTGSSTIGQSFYLDYSDYTGCYLVVSTPETYSTINIQSQFTEDYDNCSICINSNYPSPTPSPTPSQTPASSTVPRVSPSPTPSITPTQTPAPSTAPSPTEYYVVMSACCRDNFTFYIKYGSAQTVNIGSTYSILVPNGVNAEYFFGCATAIAGTVYDEDYSAEITQFGNLGAAFDDCVKCELTADCCVS